MVTVVSQRLSSKELRTNHEDSYQNGWRFTSYNTRPINNQGQTHHTQIQTNEYAQSKTNQIKPDVHEICIDALVR